MAEILAATSATLQVEIRSDWTVWRQAFALWRELEFGA